MPTRDRSDHAAAPPRPRRGEGCLPGTLDSARDLRGSLEPWTSERLVAPGPGWLVGCNFMPSTSGNQLEIFQPETYDPVTIDRELGWASELGMNSIQLYLHHLAARRCPASGTDSTRCWTLADSARHRCHVGVVRRVLEPGVAARPAT